MAEPRTDPPSPPRQPTPVPPRDGDALFDEAPPSTDDSPTIISRNGPRLTEDAASGIRGRRLAHFELIEAIGVGGMAAVLRARDTQLDRFVALKILPPELAADPENVQRFHQEARSAAKLDHENIARVFFCGEDQRLHFIAFEFVEGENLRTLLERRGRLPVAEAITYMIQIAAGLCHAGERGVVHRDIKPSNIIITPNGRAKLVDMGLARSLEPRSERDLTHSGVTLGTFDYISPEQALEPRDADVRSDIYSLGCTFYHCLTGRPPVPEGTAAKKLHHHQHVKPTDPRQLVPGLPDEVALILDRMMAKNPRARYQTPAELVQHLLQAARKIGASPEVPEGVLTVETSLPNPPGIRPLVLTVCAAAVVIGCLFLFEQPPPAPTHPRTTKNGNIPAAPDKDGRTAVTPPAADAPREKDRTPAVPERPAELVFDTEKEGAGKLREWAEEVKKARPARATLWVGSDLDLTALGGAGPGLRLEADHVRIVAKHKDKGIRPTIRLKFHQGAEPSGAPPQWSVFDVTSPDIRVEGLRFVLDADGSDVPTMVALSLKGRQQQVTDCEFLQVGVPASRDRTALTSVVGKTAGGPCLLTLTQCRFFGFRNPSALVSPDDGPDQLEVSGEPQGQEAVVRRGPVRLVLENCAFAPHATMIALERGDGSGGAGAGGEQPDVALRHCTVLAGPPSSTVFAIREGVAASLAVSASLFSRPLKEGASVKGDGAVLVRLDGRDAKLTAYTGQDNRYHNFETYFYYEKNDLLTDYGAFTAKVGERNSSRQLAGSPWKEDAKADPLALLTRPARSELARGEPFLFRVRFDPGHPAVDPRDATRDDVQLLPAFRVGEHLSDLRIGTGSDDLSIAGVVKLVRFDYLKGLDLNEKTAPVARTLTVDPDKKESANRIYTTLEGAILEAKPGDTILIKKNGELKVAPIRLKKDTGVDLTIRPQAGYHPVLTLAATDEPDVALFRLPDGKLSLEGLEFLLRPVNKFKAGPGDPRPAQSLVALVGEGSCRFKDCVVTLDPNKEVVLAAATVGDPKPRMMMDTKTTGTPGAGKLSFENCFVRGTGDLVWLRASQPFELSASNTLAALAGHFVNVDTPDAPAAPSGQQVAVTLDRVTTYLGGHLLRLNAGKDLKGLLPVQFKPDGCLFVAPPGSGKSLVHLDGPDTNSDKLADKLVWTAGTNGYGEFASMFFDQQSSEGTSVTPPMDKDRWQSFTTEKTSEFGLALKNAPAADANLAELAPADFAFTPKKTAFGADTAALQKLLPAASHPDE